MSKRIPPDSFDIDWNWSPVRKNRELFSVEMCVSIQFETNSEFYIYAIIIEGICLERIDDLFQVIRRDLDNDTSFQDHVNEKRWDLSEVLA